MTRSPTKVIPAHSHRCLVKGGVRPLSVSADFSSGVSSSHLHSNKKSPSCRLQSFLSPASGAERRSSSLLIMDSQCTQERLVFVKEAFWLQVLSYFPKSVFVSHQTAFGTDFRASVRKASSRKTLLFLSDIAMLETPKVPLILVACWRAFLGVLYLEEIRAAPRNCFSFNRSPEWYRNDGYDSLPQIHLVLV